MRLYRGIDYFIYYEDFPRMGVIGVICANRNGTANIYINTLYSREQQDCALRHELRHLCRNHLWDDCKELSLKELEAEQDDGCVFGEGYAYAEYRPNPLSEAGNGLAEFGNVEDVGEFCR